MLSSIEAIKEELRQIIRGSQGVPPGCDREPMGNQFRMAYS